MTKLAATIQCVNEKCKTLNSYQLQLCSQCRTPIVKRYLWGVGEEIKNYQVGDILGERYLHYNPTVFLDTKPALPPELPEDIVSEIRPYLKLFPYRLYLPQIYAYIPTDNPIWLLEYGQVPLQENGNLSHNQLFPRLDEVWSNSSALRQLYWLWQIMQLWQPLTTNKVVSTLFNPELLRVNGSLIQLLELQPDHSSNLTLEKLGEFWLFFTENCRGEIKEIVTNISLCLQYGLMREPEQVLNILDEAIAQLAKNSFSTSFQIVTRTDPGKVRDNNEDACYPPAGEIKNTEGGIDTLTIVCDGLGGQEGGEVASNWAIKHISQYLTHFYRRLSQNNQNKEVLNIINDQAIINKLSEAICSANDLISNKNKEEKRLERARMGTTVVMTLGLAHQMYIAHVGDSRVYWISKDGCYQMTVDDDLAVREVRLGYAFYRDVIQYPQTGALLQALGMDDSQHLHPHIQKFIFDQDCVFLLCSDGLSDFDRVEQYWESNILSLLNGELNITQVAENLLNIGLEKNGHDNISIALVYCKVIPKEERNNLDLSWKAMQEIIPDLPNPSDNNKHNPKANLLTLAIVKHYYNLIVRSSLIGQILLLVIIILVGTGLVVLIPKLLDQKQQNRNDSIENTEENNTPQNSQPPVTPDTLPSPENEQNPITPQNGEINEPFDSDQPLENGEVPETSNPQPRKTGRTRPNNESSGASPNGERP
jgi:protein phosphatase